MNQYQKVATVLIRSVAVGAFALGVFGLLYGAVLHSRGASLTADQLERWGGSMIGLVPAAAGNAGATPHAYYLFLAGAPQGCEDCYVPLLITHQTLDEVASSASDSAVVLITTYERDSIWKVERDVPLAAVDVSVRERIVRLQGRRYRCQEIAPAEVLRLLEKPEGTIPIHRIAPTPGRKALEDLIVAFRARN